MSIPQTTQTIVLASNSTAPLVIAIISLLVAAASLSVTFLNFLRDRGKVKCWSEIWWLQNAPDQEEPILRVGVVNCGRRPVVVKGFVIQGGGGKWYQSMSEPTFKNEPEDSPQFVFDKLRRHTLAQSASVRLSEAEPFEREFRVDDWVSNFVSLQQDDVFEAEVMTIAGVDGRHYEIKDIGKNLATLQKAWIGRSSSA